MTEVIISIIVAVIRVFLPAVITAKPTAEDGDKATTLRDTLRNQVRGTWGRGVTALAVCAILAGCAARTIYVPDGTPVRLREALENVQVWVLDKDQKPVATKMNIPEGWYALPMSEPEKGK